MTPPRYFFRPPHRDGDGAGVRAGAGREPESRNLTPPTHDDYGEGPRRSARRRAARGRHFPGLPATVTRTKGGRTPWHATRWFWLTAAGSIRRSPSSGST